MPEASILFPLLSLAVHLALSVALPLVSKAQQSISFVVEGYPYQAQVNWVVKHGGSDFSGKTSHQLNRTQSNSFDLVVFFNFKNDTVPGDENLVWGFQFDESGGLIAPGHNDKRSRSFKLFQRFQLLGSGNGSLVINPKIWRKNRSGQFDVIALAPPFKLDFEISEGSGLATTGPGSALPSDSAQNVLLQTKPIVPKSTAPSSAEEEVSAYKLAISEVDSTQKIKALMGFVDRFSPNSKDETGKPASSLVTEAIKNVPLAADLPKKTGANTFSYTLNYAVKPVVDTSSVKGYRWKLSEFEFGRYQLILDYLGDSVHSFKIADLGKNAPYNQPREFRPFEKVSVTLVGQDNESFKIRLSGGIPPFIAFLSQNHIPKARYFIEQTDTVLTIAKASCELCKSGEHTLEVYSSDFSTLLLRANNAIQISRINYFLIGITCIAGVLLLFFLYKPTTKAWRRYQYEKRLRDIEAWEKKDPY